MPVVLVPGVSIVKPTSYTSDEYPIVGWYQDPIQGVPYSSSPEWVGKRCIFNNTQNIGGADVASITLEDKSGGWYSTMWPTLELIKIS